MPSLIDTEEGRAALRNILEAHTGAIEQLADIVQRKVTMDRARDKEALDQALLELHMADRAMQRILS